MILRGKLFAESPIYRGNARKTLFTRDGDGTQRLVSLAGEIGGTAQSLMDAFVGESKNKKNTGLLNQLWKRLYGEAMPRNLLIKVECKLQKENYPRDNFFDLRMGIKLDEDRWAAESNANYKNETLFRHSAFDFIMHINEVMLKKDDNTGRLYYLLQELEAGRFWFGAGKSKGLGRCRLELDKSLAVPQNPPHIRSRANHLQINLTFNAANPVLVGWNWGKVDHDNIPAFSAIEGRLLVGAMRDIPDPIRQRLEMGIGGPILNPEDWKRKLTEYLPRVIAALLNEQSSQEVDTKFLTPTALKKLGKGRHGLSKKIIKQLEPLLGQTFSDPQVAEAAVKEALGTKANMSKRVLGAMERKVETVASFDKAGWLDIATSLGLNGDTGNLTNQIAAQLGHETALIETLTKSCQKILPRLYQQVDQQIHMLQSDSWVDTEIASRQEHLKIKMMLSEGKIKERQWDDRHKPPPGVSTAAWYEFKDSHHRVRFRHLLNLENLGKSITNDRNFINFLTNYRDRTRQELAQPGNIDFRAGGANNREISKKYGKHYDTVFMRMLSWAPSSQEEGAWEIYVPGSTIKGAFRKRASQVLKTLWGESNKTDNVIETLFGRQRQRGLVLFSDAYLTNPDMPEQVWCSMDGVRMNSKTGQPLDQSKHDYLFGYGNQLAFNLRLDIPDINERSIQALSVLFHLLQDFQNGDIPVGGEKSSGMGWVKAKIAGMDWLTTNPGGVSKDIWGDLSLTQAGIWHKLSLAGQEAVNFLQPPTPLEAQIKSTSEPPRAKAGFISHRAFGGYCGTLSVEAEILTPLSVQESGQPSFTAMLDDGPVNGWDFFSMSPPTANQRLDDRIYALPSKSIRGMLRHIYTIASNSSEASPNIGQLNPTDSLFGWVGSGQNQSIMGRLSIGFAYFESPQLAWFKMPYPYGGWHYNSNNGWQHTPGNSVSKLTVADNWRLFAHAPLAPAVKQLSEFKPDTSQANYLRAILPGARSHFSLRFWNLTETEMQRLIWCLVLEDGLAHKMGKGRQLGFGSLRFNILPASYLIDWSNKYAGKSEKDWQLPVQVKQWLKADVINHYAKLRKALNANQL